MLGKLNRLAVLVVCLAALTQANPAPFDPCPERQVTATDVAVDVSGCNVTEACPLYRGTSHDFTVYFTPTVSSANGIERVIIAKFPGRRSIEIPYGPPLDSDEKTIRNSDGQTVKQVGVVSGEPYTHTDVFPVMRTAPPSGLRVRYIIREKVAGLSRRQSRWAVHPGKMFTCVEIPVQLI